MATNWGGGDAARLRGYRDPLTWFGLAALVGLQLIQRYANIAYGDGTWSWDLRTVWTRIAADVAGGVPLYVEPAVDNKPPLWELVTVAAIGSLPRPALLALVFAANLALVGCVYLLARRRYGYWIGVFAALLLVGTLPGVEGLEVQPHNLAAALVLLGLLASDRFVLGATLGTATMVVQYGGLALPAYLLQLHREHGLTRATLTRFGAGLAGGVAVPFGIVAVIWGWPSLRGAIYWTFVAPAAYLPGIGAADPPYAASSNAFSPVHNPAFWFDVVAEFALHHAFVVVPAILASGLVVVGRRDQPELVYVVAGGFLLVPHLVRAFPHYWLFSLPFMCLLTGSFLDEIVPG